MLFSSFGGVLPLFAGISGKRRHFENKFIGGK
jgi:hypothetical protein